MPSEQLTFFDIMPDETDVSSTKNLKVVKAVFNEVADITWRKLFEGYDEIYGITFSSGIQFMEKVMDMFEHVEMIFGCEGVVSDDLAALLAMQTKSVEQIAKSKSAKRMAERIENGQIVLSVSRDTKSHEKIFILKSNDGRTRVITGSANMSASAFCGLQREDIVCFDDKLAYEYYKERFDEFRDKCSDNVNQKVLLATIQDEGYIRNNIEEVPIMKTIEDRKFVILETSIEEQGNDEIEIIADIKGLEKEMKPLIPKQKNERGKIIYTGDYTKAFKRKYKEVVDIKKFKEKQLPKLHIDYENSKLWFNGKEMNLNPDKEKVKSDIQCVINYMASLASFYGDWQQSQRDYFAFMNWYFASLFMPYLRYVGNKNSYDVTPFPVFGILYGDSNGGKTTFIKLLSKLMCGVRIQPNNSGDFTSTNIENLKRACEGLPINIDDLAKAQYDAHYEKIIKDDGWGLSEGFINYPSVAVSTNKLSALKPDIARRTVAFYIGIKLDKEVGAKNSKRINESMKQATTSFYCEYVRLMLTKIITMTNEMKASDENYFPDIFEMSSDVLYSIFEQNVDEMPKYVVRLTYSDYFGDRARGKNAMKKFITAWENDKKNFKIDKKKNTLTYEYTDSSRTYELKYIQQELPPVLNAQVVGSSIVLDLDKANSVFGLEFRKRFWE